MKFTSWITAITISFAFTGCASITSSEMQTLSLTTHGEDGKVAEAAKCTLKNDKGVWESTSPGFVSVHRSAEVEPGSYSDNLLLLLPHGRDDNTGDDQRKYADDRSHIATFGERHAAVERQVPLQRPHDVMWFLACQRVERPMLGHLIKRDNHCRECDTEPKAVIANGRTSSGGGRFRIGRL